MRKSQCAMRNAQVAMRKTKRMIGGWRLAAGVRPAPIAYSRAAMVLSPSLTPTARRRKRRRNLIVLTVFAIVVGVIYGVTRAQGEREVTRSYLDVAYEVSTREADAAATFANLVVSLEEFSRTVFLSNLEDLETEADALASLLASADPPPDLLQAHQFLQIAAASWRSGMSTATAGLTVLSTNPLDEDAAADVDRGLIDLRVGDRAYVGFLSQVVDVDTALLGGDFPAAIYVPSRDDALFDARELARRMFIAPGITPVDDLAIADLNLDPAPVGSSEGFPVVPISTSQSVTVAVSNRGNLGVTAITVSLQLLSNTGDLYEAAQEIAGLEGGAKVSLTFSDLPVTPGSIYEVTVSIPSGDDEPDNDSISFQFIVNADA